MSTYLKKGITNRIEWCDIFKGLIILLVVIGHATGEYHRYIYQFHMAAFFFISGYTTNFRKYSTIEVILKKFFGLMLPYLFFSIIGTVLFFFLSKLNVLHYVSTTEFPKRFQDAFLAIFTNGASYCDWLGALWFVPVLFGACIISKLLYVILERNTYILNVSMLLFLIGQWMSFVGGNSLPTDLVFLAQYYVTIGSLIKESDALEKKGRTSIHILIVITAIVVFFTIGKTYTVDWPSREFNGIWDMVIPFSGILLCIVFAKLLEKMKYLKSIFIVMGAYSFSIMVFHFLSFKISYLILIIMGREDYSALSLLTPNNSIRSNMWWGFVTAISIIVSMLLWGILMKSKMFRLFCENEFDGVKVCLADSVLKYFVKTYRVLLRLITELSRKIITNIPKYKPHIILLCITILGVTVYNWNENLEVRFPYNGEQIKFEDGWLPQSPTEEYRWVGQNSNIRVILLEQSNVHIHGYIPDNVEGMGEMKIFFNGKEIYHEDVDKGNEIDINLSLVPNKKIGVNQMELRFDGSRNPAENESDIRVFSALIDSMEFY